MYAVLCPHMAIPTNTITLCNKYPNKVSPTKQHGTKNAPSKTLALCGRGVSIPRSITPPPSHVKNHLLKQRRCKLGDLVANLELFRKNMFFAYVWCHIWSCLRPQG